MLSVLSKFNLEEDKIRVSNDDIETIEELRLLQFAARAWFYCVQGSFAHNHEIQSVSLDKMITKAQALSDCKR